MTEVKKINLLTSRYFSDLITKIPLNCAYMYKSQFLAVFKPWISKSGIQMALTAVNY